MPWPHVSSRWRGLYVRCIVCLHIDKGGPVYDDERCATDVRSKHCVATLPRLFTDNMCVCVCRVSRLHTRDTCSFPATAILITESRRRLSRWPSCPSVNDTATVFVHIYVGDTYTYDNDHMMMSTLFSQETQISSGDPITHTPICTSTFA